MVVVFGQVGPHSKLWAAQIATENAKVASVFEC